MKSLDTESQEFRRTIKTVKTTNTMTITGRNSRHQFELLENKVVNPSEPSAKKSKHIPECWTPEHEVN